MNKIFKRYIVNFSYSVLTFVLGGALKTIFLRRFICVTTHMVWLKNKKEITDQEWNQCQNCSEFNDNISFSNIQKTRSCNLCYII